MGNLISYLCKQADQGVKDGMLEWKRLENLEKKEYLRDLRPRTGIIRSLCYVVHKLFFRDNLAPQNTLSLEHNDPKAHEHPNNHQNCTSCSKTFGYLDRNTCHTCLCSYCDACTQKEEGFFSKKHCTYCLDTIKRNFEPFKDNFHRLFEVRPTNIQPISIEAAKTFRGGTYSAMISKGDIKKPSTWTTVHRIVDDYSHPSGCYYTPMKPTEGEDKKSDRMDLAILPEWNKMTESVDHSLPPGILVFGGRVAPQRSNTHEYPGGGIQYYIPREITSILFEKDGDIRNIMRRVLKKQNEFLKNYEKSIVADWNRRLENSNHLLFKDGNQAHNLPYDTFCFLRRMEEEGKEVPNDDSEENTKKEGKIAPCASSKKITTGSWVVHEEPDDILEVIIRITIRVEFVETIVEETQSVTNTTHHYLSITTIEIIKRK